MFVKKENTVKPRYNEALGTMKITLLYQVSCYIRVKKQRNIKSRDQQNYLVIRGFCYIRPLFNKVPLYSEITRGPFSKITNYLPRTSMKGHLFRIFNSYSMAGYVTAAPAFVHSKLCAREVSSFCDFWKYLLWFHCMFLYFDSSKPFVCRCAWQGLLKLICVQIWLIFMRWILMNVALKKWCFFWRSV